MVYLISYNLNALNNTPLNRTSIDNAIQLRGPWARLDQNVWLVNSNVENAATIRDAIWTMMHAGDSLFVARFQGEWGGFNISDDVVKWLGTVRF